MEHLEPRRLLALAIEVGEHYLLPDMPGQEIPIYVSGGDPVQGLNLNIQVADGGPEVGGAQDGPAITGIDLETGTLWTGLIEPPVNPEPPLDFPQWEGRYLVTLEGQVATADGLLATITIDTTGFTTGSWSLILGESNLNGPTDFAGIPVTITNGTLRINEAPAGAADTYGTAEDTPLVISVIDGVLANDSDPDAGPEPLTAVLETEPGHGSLDLAEDGSFTYTPDPDWFGMDTFSYRAWDGLAASDPITVTIEVTAVNDVVGRYLVYGNSVWDGFTATIGTDGESFGVDYTIITHPAVSDDPRYNEVDAEDVQATNLHFGTTPTDGPAIAPDKVALLPGQTATFANYSSFARGLNEIAIDVENIPDVSLITAADFGCRVGNSNDTGSWTVAPAPVEVVAVDGGGIDGTDRVYVRWEDNAIEGQWLEVTVLPANFGLTTADVFYFGNAIGEVGDDPANATVTATDLVEIRNHPTFFGNPSRIDDVHDINRDGQVNATDYLITRDHLTTFADDLNLITPGAVGQSSQAGEAAWQRAVDAAWAAWFPQSESEAKKPRYVQPELATYTDPTLQLKP